MPSIKNIAIFVGIGFVLVLAYTFFIRGSEEEQNLTSNTGVPPIAAGAPSPLEGPVIGQEFLNILFSVQNIKLDDSIFNDPAFTSLQDSSITLIPDGTEGRPNPFAPIGVDAVPVPPAPIIDSDATAPPTPPEGGDEATDTN